MLLFKESPLFTKLVRNYLHDDEYAALQWALAAYPEAGDMIPAHILRRIKEEFDDEKT